ncbi:MAG: YbjN domain-containing protein [Myxococcota bacterium]
MARDLLSELYDEIEDDLDGLTVTPDGLCAVVDGRFGEVTVTVALDVEEEMLRVSSAVAPPAGSGRSFLVWCLSINAKYWDVKTGLDDEGRLLVHSDLDATDDADIDELSSAVVERADAVVDLLDDDLVDWLLDHGLGTPSQRERWEGYRGDEEEEEE